ncbi:hypothetical protein [Streptomyces javensis]|uniref:Uncharacterized protein n=1 Tax=Streptomyces javensis TaxID=114698 RepID=A0ABP4HCV2_9ACTN
MLGGASIKASGAFGGMAATAAQDARDLGIDPIVEFGFDPERRSAATPTGGKLIVTTD